MTEIGIFTEIAEIVGKIWKAAKNLKDISKKERNNFRNQFHNTITIKDKTLKRLISHLSVIFN